MMIEEKLSRIELGDRKDYLLANCDLVEELGYSKKFSVDEIQERKDKLAEVSIEINDLDLEKKEFNENFKDRMKPLAEVKKELLDEIKTEHEFVYEECYAFINSEERIVEYYNAMGDIVKTRPAKPKEYQKTIFGVLRETANE